MKFEQAVLLLEMVKEELFSNHGVLSVRLKDDLIELHMGFRDLFESIDGDPVLTSGRDESLSYDHYKKQSGNVTYFSLYKRKKPTPVKEQAGDQGEGGASN